MKPTKRMIMVGITVLSLVCAQGVLAAVVINEVDYDQPSTDSSEFVELYNTGPGAVDLSAYTLELWNGSSNPAVLYQSFTLSGTLAAGDFYVICASTITTPNCDLDVTPDTNLIQNGAPDAMVLVLAGNIVDALSYEGQVPGYGEGTGAGTDTAQPFESLSRYPDGADTDDNATDFSLRCSTPGEPNAPAGIICEDPVPADARTWGQVKATYR